MSLDAAARRRYGRQILLGEIGDTGQVRLLEAHVRPTEGADATAYAVAEEYLRRAGVRSDERGTPVSVPDAPTVQRFAATESLAEPAAAIVGAYCAVEHLKAVLGLGEPQPFPEGISLSSED